MEKRRILYERRDEKALNLRDVVLERKGDLVVSGHDLDSDLEQFVGSSEWEDGARVKKADVPRVHAQLRKELGEGELLDLIVKKFGGTIKALRNFETWLEEHGIPSKGTRWE